MKHKTAELEGTLLDMAVAKAEGYSLEDRQEFRRAPGGGGWLLWEFEPSSKWSQAGPIIGEMRGNLRFYSEPERTLSGEYRQGWHFSWEPPQGRDGSAWGPTALVAAMRAYVASKFGEEVELP